MNHPPRPAPVAVHPQHPPENDPRLGRLHAVLRSYRSCLVAYSGGVDSVLLARVAHDVLGPRALAVIADSPSLPRSELAEAVELGRRLGFPVRVVHTAEFDNPSYLANPSNRCYFCKHALFAELAPIARNERFDVIAYGENASDASDHRPGAKAAAEFDVRAPLREAGLSKDDIRALSALLGLPTAEKPQMACLSSRIPTGEHVSPAKLRMIEAAEAFLREAGFHDLRVRHHESPSGALARIEVDDSARLAEPALASRVVGRLREVGYLHVTLDLAGYRRGSTNGSATQAPTPPASPAPIAFRPRATQP